MTTPPPGEAGWEQRLENLARAQEWAAELERAWRHIYSIGAANPGAKGRHYADAARILRHALDGGAT